MSPHHNVEDPRFLPNRACMDRRRRYRVYRDIGDAITHGPPGAESYFALLCHTWNLTSIDRPRSFPKSQISRYQIPDTTWSLEASHGAIFVLVLRLSRGAANGNG